MTMNPAINIHNHNTIINVNGFSSHNEDIIIELNHIHHELSHDDEARHDYVYHHNKRILACIELLKQLEINDDYTRMFTSKTTQNSITDTNARMSNDAEEDSPDSELNFTWIEFMNLINTNGRTNEMTNEIMPNIGFVNYEIIRNNLIIDNARIITPRKYLLMGLLSTYDDMIRIDPDDSLMIKLAETIYSYALSSEAAYNGLCMLINGYTKEYIWEQVKINSYDAIKAYMMKNKQEDEQNPS